jgi:peptidoglycan/LPS O-acetylase OafA/YrhL
MKRLSKLEAVRGFAAVYVMLGHIFSDHSILFRFGQEAVILFFLLSGFVIMYSYSRGNDKSMRVFLLKRSLRIYVPLLTVFAVNAALYAFQGYRFTCDDAGTLLGNIFMLQDVAGLKPGVVCGTFLGNQPLWSLSYEWWV